MSIYQYPLKIDTELMEKIKGIAEEQGRSVNKQIEFILKQYVEKHHDSE